MVNGIWLMAEAMPITEQMADGHYTCFVRGMELRVGCCDAWTRLYFFGLR